jgi:hypothetical protein
MITSLANAGWPGDVSLESRFEECGLSRPSIIRTSKIAVCDAALAQRIGRLPDDIWSEVRRALRANFAE